MRRHIPRYMSTSNIIRHPEEKARASFSMETDFQLLVAEKDVNGSGTPCILHVSMQHEIKVGITEAKKSTGIWRHNNRVTTLAKRNIGGLKYEEVKFRLGEQGEEEPGRIPIQITYL